ncbi:hypothetical protein WA588_003028 [Blastocystis sp. NMH]
MSTNTLLHNGPTIRIVASAVLFVTVVDSGVVQQIREKTNPDGSKEYEFYIHYIDYDKRMEEWVPASRLAPLNKKSLKRLRDVDVTYADKKTTTDASSLEKEQVDLTKIKRIESIEFGSHEINCWYYSPYPEHFQVSKLYICEFCLKYYRTAADLDRHSTICCSTHPPGPEVYRDGNLLMYEVDGNKEILYCQNLCLLTKFFIEHKTIYYDTYPFFFYIMCEEDEEGSHIVGYFSKDKNSQEGYNLACICSMPFVQRSGYGKFLISFSYELSKRENKVGSPEKPLSDLGRISYRSYWTYAIMKTFRDTHCTCSLKDISTRTSMKVDDIVSTLDTLGLLKVWKGQYVAAISEEIVENYFRTAKIPQTLCNPAKLHWKPHVPEST